MWVTLGKLGRTEPLRSPGSSRVGGVGGAEGLGAKEEKGECGAQMSPSAQGESPGMGSGRSPLGITGHLPCARPPVGSQAQGPVTRALP